MTDQSGRDEPTIGRRDEAAMRIDLEETIGLPSETRSLRAEKRATDPMTEDDPGAEARSEAGIEKIDAKGGNDIKCPSTDYDQQI